VAETMWNTGEMALQLNLNCPYSSWKYR